MSLYSRPNHISACLQSPKIVQTYWQIYNFSNLSSINLTFLQFDVHPPKNIVERQSFVRIKHTPTRATLAKVTSAFAFRRPSVDPFTPGRTLSIASAFIVCIVPKFEGSSSAPLFPPTFNAFKPLTDCAHSPPPKHDASLIPDTAAGRDILPPPPQQSSNTLSGAWMILLWPPNDPLGTARHRDTKQHLEQGISFTHSYILFVNVRLGLVSLASQCLVEITYCLPDFSNLESLRNNCFWEIAFSPPQVWGELFEYYRECTWLNTGKKTEPDWEIMTPVTHAIVCLDYLMLPQECCTLAAVWSGHVGIVKLRISRFRNLFCIVGFFFGLFLLLDRVYPVLNGCPGPSSWTLDVFVVHHRDSATFFISAFRGRWLKVPESPASRTLREHPEPWIVSHLDPASELIHVRHHLLSFFSRWRAMDEEAGQESRGARWINCGVANQRRVCKLGENLKVCTTIRIYSPCCFACLLWNHTRTIFQPRLFPIYTLDEMSMEILTLSVFFVISIPSSHSFNIYDNCPLGKRNFRTKIAKSPWAQENCEAAMASRMVL